MARGIITHLEKNKQKPPHFNNKELPKNKSSRDKQEIYPEWDDD